MTEESLTLDDEEGQYCNWNCIGCNASSLATDGIFVIFRRCGPRHNLCLEELCY